MKHTLFPTLEEALELHKQLILTFGGSEGVQDQGLLESALYRPQSGYYETLSLQAAALMQSLALNHSFLDGNKRIAFALTAVFLRMNGWKLMVAADDGENFIVHDLIESKCELLQIAEWLEAHMQRSN